VQQKKSSKKRAPILFKEPKAVKTMNFCPRCPFASERPDMFLNHVDCHFVKRKYECTKCNYSAASPRPTRFHELVHDDQHQAKQLKSTCGPRRMQSSEWPMKEHHKRLFRMVGMDPVRMEEKTAVTPLKSSSKAAKRIRLGQMVQTKCVFDFSSENNHLHIYSQEDL
jgi:hypothetical protein